MAENKIDLLTITETWPKSETDNESIIRDLCHMGYSFHHVPRSVLFVLAGLGCYFDHLLTAV